MKIFISHSSKNSLEGEALVRFLTSIGVSHDNIIFTSNAQYGVPNGCNIFNWLKEKINEKPFVIYLLSDDYYKSVACLNEMGAAWVVENDHVAIFTNNFDITNKAFQGGALDPREIAFSIDDKFRLILFGESIALKIGATVPAIRFSMAAETLVSDIKNINKPIEFNTSRNNNSIISKVVSNNDENKRNYIAKVNVDKSSFVETNNVATTSLKFIKDIDAGKTKNEEIMLAYYCMETAQFKWGVGWKKEEELQRIKEWEEMIEVESILSSNYDSAIRRFEIKNLTKVIEHTSSGNPRLVELVAEFKEFLLELPAEIETSARTIIEGNPKIDRPESTFQF